MLTRLAAAFLVLTTGCLIDGAHERSARARFALNGRQIAAPPPPARTAARSTLPTPTPPAETSRRDAQATTGAIAFAMRTTTSTYLGVEAEAGTLGWSGSNFAGGYGIAGLASTSTFGALGVELAAGRRWLRYDLTSTGDDASFVVEPRVTGELWLAPQWAFGASVGADLGERSWVAGVALTVRSSPYDRGNP